MAHIVTFKTQYEYRPERSFADLDTGKAIIPDRVARKYPNMATAAVTAHAADVNAHTGRAQVRSEVALAEQRAKRKRSVLWLADENPDTVLELDPFLKERGAPHGYVKANGPAKRMKRTRKGNVVPVPQPPTLIDRATAPGRIAADVSLLLAHAGRALAAMPQGTQWQEWCFDKLMAAGRARQDGHFDIARFHADSCIMVAEGQTRNPSNYKRGSREKPLERAYEQLAH